ncbi:hypothetical protein EGI22_17955 [Lacihabitans sp. LS3-19]|jgi:hypothetical protein|uniref:DUF6728 family protein n=1 Tax=Lacihabitans sp. LS3-19 TaxID=2487335 RepID=UPI0020CDD470|nr:DUF6728 family protein [Lacihabitans sp. LS3-19]MCP9769793.1 hypothetical protein [Lacihabitans sp. LS3-19]
MERLLSILKIGPVFDYFVRVFKKDTEGKYPTSSNLRMMHGINKISIIMGLIALIVIIYRYSTR